MSTTNKKILVIGATGMLGKPVAQQLLKDGFAVRVLARNPQKAKSLLGEGFEIAQGDFDDTASLEAAMQNCDGVHISIKGNGLSAKEFERVDYLAVKRIAETAKKMGVGRITVTSAYAVSAEKGDTPESISKHKGELALKATGVPYVIFRCSWFMETLPMFVQGKEVMLIGNQPHPLHWVAVEDYTHMVSKSYQTDAVLNKELYIFGPEAFTMGEAMKQYAAQNSLKFASMPRWMLSTLGMLTFNAEWKNTALLMNHYERWGEDGSPEEANQLLGTPKITLSDWCKHNKISA